MKRTIYRIADLVICISALLFLILHSFNRDNRCFKILYRVLYLLMNICIIIRWSKEARQKRKTRDTAERTSGAEDAVKLPFAVDQAPETEDAAKLPYAVKLKEDYSGIPAGTAGTVITELTEDYFEVEFHGINGSEVSSWPVPGRLLERAGND